MPLCSILIKIVNNEVRVYKTITTQSMKKDKVSDRVKDYIVHISNFANNIFRCYTF